MRFAEPGEKFLGIGMGDPMQLIGGEIVITDALGLIAIYPHRDADHSKITLSTRNVLLLVCGVPGISQEKLVRAATLAVEYVAIFCGGEGSTASVLP